MARSDAEKLFTRIYARNSWRDAESRSGPGSTIARTDLLRSRLSDMVRELQVRSLLDVPCGDFNWMRLTELPGVDYVGADVVLELVRASAWNSGLKFRPSRYAQRRAAQGGLDHVPGRPGAFFVSRYCRRLASDQRKPVNLSAGDHIHRMHKERRCSHRRLAAFEP